MLTHTFATLKKAAQHALGGKPDARISSGLIVNRALNHLINAHPWAWRLATATLDIVANQATLALPADFGELVSIRAAGCSTVRQLDANEFQGLSLNGFADSTFLGFLLTVTNQTVPTATPAWVLMIAPTPASSLAAGITLLYRRQIPMFTIDDVSTADDLKVPAIPPGQHDTLYALVRAYAVAMEENPATQEWALANQALQRDIMAAGRAKDPVLGVMRGCVVDEYESVPYRGGFHLNTSDFTG